VNGDVDVACALGKAQADVGKPVRGELQSDGAHGLLRKFA
jgi:hypothetical protein